MSRTTRVSAVTLVCIASLAVGCSALGDARAGTRDDPQVESFRSGGLIYRDAYRVVEKSIPRIAGCYSAQATGIGRKYVYTLKRNGDDSMATIHRTNQATGVTTLMHNGRIRAAYATSLGHGNDMALLRINREMLMYIVTNGGISRDGRLVKLKYTDDGRYFAKARYVVKLGAAIQPVTGVKALWATSTTVKLLLAAENRFFRGYVAADATGGTVIHVNRAFTVDLSHIRINGVVGNYSRGWSTQGFGYDKDTDSVYFPMTKANKSIVAIYRTASLATGTVVNDPRLSYKITSSLWPYKFEIESVGKGANGKLWFSANRKKVANGATNNMVGYFR
jgi:hypothetical protein